MSLDAVLAAAQGRWPDVLTRMGLDAERLVNRHGPCPACGGTDRFRFDDKDGRGTWYCNACGAGDGLKLLQVVHGWSCGKAMHEVAELLGVAMDEKPRQDDDRRDRRAWLRELWRECSDDRQPLLDYLAGRGLTTAPDTLRYHPALPYTVEGEVVSRHPAMLAQVLGKDGSVQGLHRTYLADVRTRKKLTTPVTSYTGAAIQLMAAGDTLAVAEGIETALAVHEIARRRDWSLPVWALGNTSLMKAWVPPEGVARVIVCADHDENYAGHAAAYALAHRLVTRHGLHCEVRMPPRPGDWLDVWNGRRAA